MTKSLDELYAPKAMSLDELFAAIRPPPLLPVGYGSSDNGASMPANSAPAANMNANADDRQLKGIPGNMHDEVSR